MWAVAILAIGWIRNVLLFIYTCVNSALCIDLHRHARSPNPACVVLEQELKKTNQFYFRLCLFSGDQNAGNNHSSVPVMLGSKTDRSSYEEAPPVYTLQPISVCHHSKYLSH